jgi:hypothetical protein
VERREQAVGLAPWNARARVDNSQLDAAFIRAAAHGDWAVSAVAQGVVDQVRNDPFEQAYLTASAPATAAGNRPLDHIATAPWRRTEDVPEPVEFGGGSISAGRA